MKQWYEAVKQAWNLYMNKDNYVYFYGAKNVKLTDAMMNNLWNSSPNYFKKYTAEEKKQIFNNSRNKIGLDCSAFTGLCTGDMTYSLAQKEHSKPNKSIADGKAGSILFTTNCGVGRHIGLDCGLGFCMHIGCESTDANIKNKKAGILLEKVNNASVVWEYSGESTFLDYTGSSNK